MASMTWRCSHPGCTFRVSYDRATVEGAQYQQAEGKNYVILTCAMGHSGRYEIPWPES